MIHVVGLAIGGQLGDPVVGEGLRGGGVRHLKRNGANIGPCTVFVLGGGGGAGVETRRVGREGGGGGGEESCCCCGRGRGRVRMRPMRGQICVWNGKYGSK